MPKSEWLLSLFTQSLFFCSHCSLQKSDPEAITPVVLYKRVTMSDSLPLLMTKEWQERFPFFTSKSLFHSQKNERFARKTKEQISTQGKTQDWWHSLPPVSYWHARTLGCMWLVCHRSSYEKVDYGKGWEFVHSLIAHLLICSNCSEKMSECERFTQVAQDKWATVSKSLSSLMTNEWMWAICSGCSWQMSGWANRSVFF